MNKQTAIKQLISASVCGQTLRLWLLREGMKTRQCCGTSLFYCFYFFLQSKSSLKGFVTFQHDSSNKAGWVPPAPPPRVDVGGSTDRLHCLGLGTRLFLRWMHKLHRVVSVGFWRVSFLNWFLDWLPIQCVLVWLRSPWKPSQFPLFRADEAGGNV